MKGMWDRNFFIDDFINKASNFKCQNLIFDDLGKSPKRVLSVIPAEAGIQGFL
jgi:hypothetical protein